MSVSESWIAMVETQARVAIEKEISLVMTDFHEINSPINRPRIIHD